MEESNRKILNIIKIKRTSCDSERTYVKVRDALNAASHGQGKQRTTEDYRSYGTNHVSVLGCRRVGSEIIRLLERQRRRKN